MGLIDDCWDGVFAKKHACVYCYRHFGVENQLFLSLNISLEGLIMGISTLNESVTCCVTFHGIDGRNIQDLGMFDTFGLPDVTWFHVNLAASMSISISVCNASSFQDSKIVHFVLVPNTIPPSCEEASAANGKPISSAVLPKTLSQQPNHVRPSHIYATRKPKKT